jgi:hypothetical protein
VARELILLVAGFGLTTVLGGLLGSWLQRRSWDHQNAARLVEEELRSADGISQRLSQLLDKRLYRMLRLYYALYPTPDRQVSRDVLEQRLAEYDVALFDWNDQLNLNLAKVGTYFGEPARDWLAHEIYESFQDAGARLEMAYRRTVAGRTPEGAADLQTDLNALNDQVYRLGVFMMTQLRSGTVGRNAPAPLARETSPGAVAGRGTPLAGLPASE